MAKKRVIIACGNGVATSTVVASKVKDYCAANGVSIEVTQCRMIDRLEESGLVERRRDPADRRAWQLFLTGKAKPMLADLKATLKAAYGKEPLLNVTVDPSLLAGLVVKVGSKMIDSSLKTKLNALKTVLTEA